MKLKRQHQHLKLKIVAIINKENILYIIDKTKCKIFLKYAWENQPFRFVNLDHYILLLPVS